MGKTNTFTRKIELRFNLPHKDERAAAMKQLKIWRSYLTKAANLISSHLYLTLNESDIIYRAKQHLQAEIANDILDIANKKKEIQAETAKEIKESFIIKTDKTGQSKGVHLSETAAMYRLASLKFLEHVPSGMITALNNNVVGTFNKLKGEYLRNERSLSVYKETIPLPFPAQLIQNVRWEEVTEYSNQTRIKTATGYEYIDQPSERKLKTICFTLFKIPFYLRFGMDLSGNKTVMEKAFSDWFLPSWVHDHEAALSRAIIQNEEFLALPGNEKKTIPFDKIPRENCELPQDFFLERIAEEYREGKKTIKEQHYLVKTSIGGEERSFMMKEATDKGNKVYRIVADYKFCDSSIQIKDRPSDKVHGDKRANKIFLLAVIEKPIEKRVVNDANKASAILSPTAPIIIDFKGRLFEIGNYAEIIYKRASLQAAYYRKQKVKRMNIHEGNSGRSYAKGRTRGEWSKTEHGGKEKKYFKNKSHELSKKIIDFCFDNDIKHLSLLGVSAELKKAEDVNWLIRNWGWSNLSTLIKIKGAKCGIEVKLPTEEEEKPEEVD